MRTDRDAVLDAAGKYLSSNPRASTQEIATAAGISRMTLHRHFPTREALIEEIGRLALRRVIDAFEAARPEDDDFTSALQRIVTVMIPLTQQYLYLEGEFQLRQDEEILAASTRFQAQICNLFRRGQREGVIRSDFPLAWFGHTLAGLLYASEEALRMGTIAPREAVRLVMESFLQGAAVPRDNPERTLP